MSLGSLALHLKPKGFFKNKKKNRQSTKGSSQRQRFNRQLLILVFLGSFLQECLHVVYYSLGMFLEFRFPDTEAFVAGYAYTFALGIAFSTAFCVSTLIQLTIASPLFATSNTDQVNKLHLKLSAAENLYGVFKFIAPNLVMWTTIWILLGLGIIQSPIILFRLFLGSLSLPLILQARILRRTGNNVITLIDQIKATVENNDESLLKFEEVQTKMKAYVKWMGFLLDQNGVMALIIAVTPVLHNIDVFFVIALLFGFSLVGVGTLVIYLFSKQKMKPTTQIRSKLSSFYATSANTLSIAAGAPKPASKTSITMDTTIRSQDFNVYVNGKKYII